MCDGLPPTLSFSKVSWVPMNSNTPSYKWWLVVWSSEKKPPWPEVVSSYIYAVVAFP